MSLKPHFTNAYAETCRVQEKSSRGIKIDENKLELSMGMSADYELAVSIHLSLLFFYMINNCRLN